MKTYQAGIDVGSTTVKLVVLDENGQMIFWLYQRHLSHTQRALSDLLKQARAALGECALELRATGSGAIHQAKAHGIPVRNGIEAISELKPDEEQENSEEDKPDIGSGTLHLPAFKAMAVCNQRLDHGPISIELDGSVILELADRLISDPGVHIEIGG